MDLGTEPTGGPIGPDSLRLPGAPARLRQAVQSLHDLVGTLDRAAEVLHAAAPQAGSTGAVVTAMSHVATTISQRLGQDTHALRDLAGALDHEGDVLRDAQSATLPELRSRWHAARAELAQALLDEARDGGHAAPGAAGHGHPSAQQLAGDIDAEVARGYEPLVRRWLGATVQDAGGSASSAAVRVGGPLDEGVRRYRQTVQGILEDFADAVRRIETADQQVAGKLPRPEHDVPAAGGSAGTSAPTSPGTAGAADASSPHEVGRLAEELQRAEDSVRDASHALEQIRLDVRGGRMLPVGERVGSSDGFERDWDTHLEQVRSSLDQVRQHAEAVQRRLRQVEEDGAHTIRNALR